MAAHLVCLTNEGGVPLFSRSAGSGKPLTSLETALFAENLAVFAIFDGGAVTRTNRRMTMQHEDRKAVHVTLSRELTNCIHRRPGLTKDFVGPNTGVEEYARKCQLIGVDPRNIYAAENRINREKMGKLAFAEQGMLYGVQMFAQNHGVTLQSTDTEVSKVVWRVFHDSIVLVLVQDDDGSSHVHANTLLDHVFQTMVMYLGLDTMSRLQNIERLRRDLKVCYPVIDALLEDSRIFDSISETVQVVSTPEAALMQEPLQNFVTECDSTFGCVHCNGRLLVATPKWWSLSGQEMMLLCRLVHSLPTNSASDIPVYLPHASPKVPHRLISVHLLSGLVVSVLCLDVPTLEAVQSKLIETHWLPHFETLKACLRTPIANIPKNIPLDPCILGYLVINTDQHKCITSCELPVIEGSMAERRPLTVAKRKQILASFYRNTVGTIFPVVHSPEREDPSGDRPSSFPHIAEETYMNGLDHKCYAIISKEFRLFVVFSSAVPHHAVRFVTCQFLENLKKDKSFTDLREKT